MLYVAHAYVCASVCAHVCASVIREIKHPFQHNTISLNAYILCTRWISLIHVMWDYLFILICPGDMALRGPFDRVI